VQKLQAAEILDLRAYERVRADFRPDGGPSADAVRSRGTA